VPDPPSRVGKDRLAAALGALRLCADCAWVVVDSGTAITVNAVLPSPFVSQSFRSLQDKTTEKERKGPIGVFEGGLILPGEGLGLRSLSQGTAQLPRLPYWPAESEVPTIGRSTEEAIRAGTRQLILHGVLGIIKAQIKDIQTVMGDKGCHGRITTAISDEVRVVITGGGAKVIWPEVENELACNKPAWDPYLVHRGLYMAWLHQTQE
jgi:pantothenate kinase type III